MSKSLDGYQVALFFSQSSSHDVEALCEVAMGVLPDSMERQKATGVTIASVVEGPLQVRFVLNAIRCDIHFIAQQLTGAVGPFSSVVSYEQVTALAKPVVHKAAKYFQRLQRLGLVVAQVERCASPAAALTALKRSLPFEFAAPPSSEDVAVQYNVRREVHAAANKLELNQLHHKTIGTVQTIQVGPEGAQVQAWSAFRDSLDVNTTGIGPELEGSRLAAAIDAVFKTMDSAMAGK